MIAVFPAPGAPVMMNLLIWFSSANCGLSRNTFRKSSDLAQNQLGICRPHKRLGIFVALIQVVEHRLLQGSNGRVASAADASFGHFGKQSSHEVQPTATGRGVVNV